jgi:hypothetical protein
MKKVILGALLLLSTLSFSQKICKLTDEFSDKIIYSVDKGIVLKESSDKAFRLDAYLKEYNGKIIFSELMVKAVGVGCIEKESTLVIIFENGEKTSFIGWNKFNCDGNMWASLTIKGEELLKTQKIKKLQFMNKSNYKTITVLVNPLDESFFINLFKEIELGNLSGFKNCAK